MGYKGGISIGGGSSYGGGAGPTWGDTASAAVNKTFNPYGGKEELGPGSSISEIATNIHDSTIIGQTINIVNAIS